MVNMGIYKSEIANLRKNIDENIGSKIILKESPGKRSKPQERSAVIDSTYKDYFRVKFDEIESFGSYNYTDLFTKTIEVKVFNGGEYYPIYTPKEETKRHKITIDTNSMAESC